MMHQSLKNAITVPGILEHDALCKAVGDRETQFLGAPFSRIVSNQKLGFSKLGAGVHVEVWVGTLPFVGLSEEMASYR